MMLVMSTSVMAMLCMKAKDILASGMGGCQTIGRNGVEISGDQGKLNNAFCKALSSFSVFLFALLDVGGPADPIAPTIIIPPKNTSVMVGTFEVTLECVANARCLFACVKTALPSTPNNIVLASPLGKICLFLVLCPDPSLSSVLHGVRMAWWSVED